MHSREGPQSPRGPLETLIALLRAFVQYKYTAAARRRSQSEDTSPAVAEYKHTTRVAEFFYGRLSFLTPMISRWLVRFLVGSRNSVVFPSFDFEFL
jgi:hypothetical protein